MDKAGFSDGDWGQVGDGGDGGDVRYERVEERRLYRVALDVDEGTLGEHHVPAVEANQRGAQLTKVPLFEVPKFRWGSTSST